MIFTATLLLALANPGYFDEFGYFQLMLIIPTTTLRWHWHEFDKVSVSSENWLTHGTSNFRAWQQLQSDVILTAALLLTLANSEYFDEFR